MWLLVILATVIFGSSPPTHELNMFIGPAIYMIWTTRNQRRRLTLHSMGFMHPMLLALSTTGIHQQYLDAQARPSVYMKLIGVKLTSSADASAISVIYV